MAVDGPGWASVGGMKIGVCVLPDLPWREAEPLWRRAEELGFAHAWTYDHLVWAGLPDQPWRSTMPTLAAAAVVTDRIGLGTFVTSPNFRHPALLAKDAVTLDELSGGRLLLGVGAGGDLDSRALGLEHTRGERTRRLAELVPLLDRLLTQDHVDHDGEFFTTRDFRGLPGCVQSPRVPLVVAANGPRSMRLAARYAEGWVTTGSVPGARGQDPVSAAEDVERWWRDVARLAAAMDETEAQVRESSGQGPGGGAAEAAGDGARAPLRRYLSLDSAGPAVTSDLGFAQDQLGRAAELGFTDVVVHWPRAEQPYRGQIEVLEAIAPGR